MKNSRMSGSPLAGSTSNSGTYTYNIPDTSNEEGDKPIATDELVIGFDLLVTSNCAAILYS